MSQVPSPNQDSEKQTLRPWPSMRWLWCDPWSQVNHTLACCSVIFRCWSWIWQKEQTEFLPLPAGRQGIPVEGLPGPDCLHHHEESSQHLLQCKSSLVANLGCWRLTSNTSLLGGIYYWRLWVKLGCRIPLTSAHENIDVWSTVQNLVWLHGSLFNGVVYTVVWRN